MPTEQNPNSKKKQPLTDYGKYSSLAFQMAITIALGVWGGKKLDQWFHVSSFPLFTITFSLLSVSVAIWFAVKDFFKKK